MEVKSVKDYLTIGSQFEVLGRYTPGKLVYLSMNTPFHGEIDNSRNYTLESEIGVIKIVRRVLDNVHLSLGEHEAGWDDKEEPFYIIEFLEDLIHCVVENLKGHTKKIEINSFNIDNYSIDEDMLKDMELTEELNEKIRKTSNYNNQ